MFYSFMVYDTQNNCTNRERITEQYKLLIYFTITFELLREIHIYWEPGDLNQGQALT